SAPAFVRQIPGASCLIAKCGMISNGAIPFPLACLGQVGEYRFARESAMKNQLAAGFLIALVCTTACETKVNSDESAFNPSGAQLAATIHGFVKNPSALIQPSLQVALVWPNGGMSASGVYEGATPVDLGGGAPTSPFSLGLTPSPPQDVLSLFASRGAH